MRRRIYRERILAMKDIPSNELLGLDVKFILGFRCIQQDTICNNLRFAGMMVLRQAVNSMQGPLEPHDIIKSDGWAYGVRGIQVLSACAPLYEHIHIQHEKVALDTAPVMLGMRMHTNISQTSSCKSLSTPMCRPPCLSHKNQAYTCTQTGRRYHLRRSSFRRLSAGVALRLL